MKFGSWPIGLICGALLLAVLFMIAALPLLGGPPEPGTALTANAVMGAQMGAQMGALPAYVKIWMEFQHYVFAASLFFVLWRKDAQIYALGIFASHFIVFLSMSHVPIEKLNTGLAALSHFVWIIPLVVLIRAWPALDKKTGYGTWATVAIFQIVVSLCFDLPQGTLFLISLFS